MQQGEAAPVAKVLERELLPPYDDVTHQYVYGLPRFQEATFTNTYPLPHWEFTDEDIPLEIDLEVYNPFVPLDLDKSSYPIAVFNWNIHNPTNEPVEASISFNMENPIIAERLLNEFFEQGDVQGVRFAAESGAEVNYQGGMIVGTTAPDVQVQTHWYEGRWRDDAHVFWNDFSDDGRIEPVTENSYNQYKEVSYNETSGRNSSVLVHFRLNPGERKTIPFYLSWYFPQRVFTLGETFGIQEAANQPFENYYSNLFQSEADVLQKFLAQEDTLHALTQDFTDILYQSTYPSYVIEALSTQASTLKTNLIQVTAEGDVHGFEGVLNNGWCCPGTCTHVWNYEQTLASLFPPLERRMRSIEFMHNTHENGFQEHRSVFPLGNYGFNGAAAADGQMGSIVRVYREWKLSGDTEWLEFVWPQVKKALEFAWYGPGEVENEALKYQESQTPWDPQKKGVLTGRQHNTYDISFFGPNSMTTSLYLAALKACSEMAEALGEKENAEMYEAVYEAGVMAMENTLWNGEYFIQIVTEDPEADMSNDYELSPTNDSGERIPKYQYGTGCLADQLLGQYLAHISGLGYILDKAKVDRAVHAIYQYNFMKELRDFANVQRVYALNEEAGVILCSWPKGNRPVLPFVYADEIWTGVEYQVAASLIYSGLVKEGLEVVKAIQERHDGFKRNPFEHSESGVHYARAMASWSVLLALSGFDYDGVQKTMAFAPQLHQDNFSTFWSTGSAWGNFTLKDQQAELTVAYGELELTAFGLGKNYDIQPVSHKGKVVKKNDISTLVCKKPIVLKAGERLVLSVQ